MCGIAGQFNFDPAQPVDRERVEAMTSIVMHRGPDAGGIFVGAGIGLGHRRLSIIDLSSGDQPMTNEDRTIWVVFNGEIYNFADIRAELECFGHRFRTHTDTEVIVHGYEQWGDRVVDRFRGMFAFGLWDSRKHRLLLVRDRLGVKPLHYCVTDSGVVFGSELKSLLQNPDVPRDWSAEALDAYLTLQYVPGPQTMFRAISKLPPGHTLVAEGGRVTIRKYWDLTFRGDGQAAREEEYLERLDALVNESVRLRLVSDVPLGAFLSGGIDSSAVVASMAEACPGRVVTTTVGFDEHDFNELTYARAVATHLGVDQHEAIVRPDIADLLPKLAWHFDEPFADSSAVATYYVSKAAREHVTVALSGDGGDELWAGYARHRVEQMEIRVRRWLGPGGSRLAGRVGEYLPLQIKGARSLRHLSLAPADACARKHAFGLFEPGSRSELYSDGFASAVRDADPFTTFRLAYAGCPSRDPLDCALYLDVKTYLVDDIMTKVDRMSMAVSLEAREPLLDHKLLEFAASVPTSLKLKGGRSKHLLRRLLARRIPQAIVDRPKHGFEIPVGEWLRGPLAPMVDSLLLDGRLRDRGIFDQRTVARLVQEHSQRRSDHRHRLWSLVMLELWFRQYVDSSGSQTDAFRVTSGEAA
ncbi:MAG TPA: asparagine synthase (glutamine-hydrolyzing) [Vicinamibacterales bacterium]|jgi:asparagine synthase (glutamine-hydrolysing)